MTMRGLRKSARKADAHGQVAARGATPVKSRHPQLKVARGSRQRRLLSEAVQLEEEVVPQFLRPALLMIGVLVFGLIAWAYVTKMPEVASVPGEVAPSGSLKVVQHPAGGVVKEVLVGERDLVEAGQPLVRLDADEANSRLSQLRGRRASLRIRAERLRAFADGREPDFGWVDAEHADLVAGQMDIWRNQASGRDSRLTVLDNQIAQQRNEVTQQREALEIAERQQTLIHELLDMRRRMVERQLVSRVEFMETQRAGITADGEVLRLRKEIDKSGNALVEIENRRVMEAGRLRQEALDELGTVNAELAEVQKEVERARMTSERLELRAPVRGLVQNLAITTEGEVINPSDTLMQIVPVDEILEVKVRIPTRDIGHLQPGQAVKVKVTSYNYTRFGSVDGVLRQVSASNLIDENNQPYFGGWVTLDRAYLGDRPDQYRILPGMSVNADIVTGENTLLQYLIKPVSDAVNSAFRER